MSTKQILTRKQAVAILVQAKNGNEADIMFQVDKNHKLFNLSNIELEGKLSKIIDMDLIAGVVDDET